MVVIFTKLKPIGHGRCGERVENTPVFVPFNLGGATLARTCVESFL